MWLMSNKNNGKPLPYSIKKTGNRSEYTNYGRGVTREAWGAQFPGRRIIRGAPKSNNNVTSTIFNTAFASERAQVRTWKGQTCFLPRAPSNVVTPLIIGAYLYLASLEKCLPSALKKDDPI